MAAFDLRRVTAGGEVPPAVGIQVAVRKPEKVKPLQGQAEDLKRPFGLGSPDLGNGLAPRLSAVAHATVRSNNGMRLDPFSHRRQKCQSGPGDNVVVVRGKE